MTEWTDSNTINTSWNSGTGQNTNTVVLYNNSSIKYDLDYITYDGYYVEDETDWASSSTIETSWADA